MKTKFLVSRIRTIQDPWDLVNDQLIQTLKRMFFHRYLKNGRRINDYLTLHNERKGFEFGCSKNNEMLKASGLTTLSKETIFQYEKYKIVILQQ